MEIRYRVGSEEIQLSADASSGGWRVRLPDGSERYIEATRLDRDVLRINAGDRAIEVPFAVSGSNVLISYGGSVYEFSPVSLAPSTSAKAEAKSGAITAPMVGTLTRLMVHEGEEVSAYQPLAVIEAMKVLVTLEAPFAGIVRNLKTEKGDRVEHGAEIMEIVPTQD